MTVNFTHLGEHGRFGNQLFQVAATINAARKLNADCIIPETWEYRSSFNLPERLYGKPTKGVGINTGQFHFKQNYLDNVSTDIDLFDYFQSEKYFYENRDDIKNYLTPLNITYLDEWSVGIHIRRGDYVGNDSYVQYPPQYYLSAIEKYFSDSRYKFYISTDDVEYAKFHFCGDQFVIEERTPIEDFKTLIGCQNLIICNSSFSWWAAYLSKAGLVIRPPRIFTNRLSHYIESDFWQPQWIKHDNFKIDLTDTTFIIPVKYDHIHRKENLNLCVKMLQDAFDTNIIVGEQGFVSSFKYIGKTCRYIHFNGLPAFHRTKMLNRMTELSKTSIVVNWDADIILPPLQILNMVKMLRGDYDFVYPYDGRFARVGREWLDKLTNDAGILKGVMFPGLEPERLTSYGGAVGYNKFSFIDAGMENEHFISYGPEDFCRYHRFKLFGKVGRVEGVMYHINHYCGADSTSKNPAFLNNEKEWRKVKAMGAKELREYMTSWSWLQQKSFVLVTYADDKYEVLRKRLTDIADTTGNFDHIFCYDRKWLVGTDFYKENKEILDMDRGGGYWLWKPYCILQALDSVFYGDYVMYLDSGDIITGDLRSFVLNSGRDMILTKGVHQQQYWTKRDCFTHMGCDTKEYKEAIQLEAGIFVCKKTDDTIRFVQEWLDWCKQKEVVTDMPFRDEISGFKDHRHDQSILTNLAVKYKVYVSDEMREFVRCNVDDSFAPLDETVTLVIPLFYDGKDRVANVNTILQYYERFGVKVIVMEQIEHKFAHLRVDKYMRFDEPEFHRTKMINEMVKEAQTEIVVICDADVIVPEDQFVQSIKLISSGEADIVYPYSNFVKLDPVRSHQLRQNCDVKPIQNESGRQSYGGMVFANKQKYLDAGGENEKFKVWGYEDIERKIRFEKLGYKVARVPGNLYHLHHYIGPNSSTYNPYYESNKQEAKRVSAMSKEELIAYIKTW